MKSEELLQIYNTQKTKRLKSISTRRKYLIIASASILLLSIVAFILISMMKTEPNITPESLLNNLNGHLKSSNLDGLEEIFSDPGAVLAFTRLAGMDVNFTYMVPNPLSLDLKGYAYMRDDYDISIQPTSRVIGGLVYEYDGRRYVAPYEAEFEGNWVFSLVSIVHMDSGTYDLHQDSIGISKSIFGIAKLDKSEFSAEISSIKVAYDNLLCDSPAEVFTNNITGLYTYWIDCDFSSLCNGDDMARFLIDFTLTLNDTTKVNGFYYDGIDCEH